MQKVTVTFTTADGVDAEKLVAALARQGQGVPVLVEQPKYGVARDITFVSTETVEESAS